MPEAYPLQWPEDWKRTHPHSRRRAPYQVSDGRAIDGLNDALRKFKASSIVISSNIATKRNGDMYANQAASIEDPGVAVYYSTPEFKDRVIACDKWERVYHNVHAIGKALEALRAVDRAGASQILDRAFQAFGALPSPAGTVPVRAWWEVLEIEEQAIKLGFMKLPMIEAQYRELAKAKHPDRNDGNDAAFKELGTALEQARKHFA